MKMLNGFNAVFMCAGLVSAQLHAGTSICQQYWDARKSGKDWAMQPPLHEYDSMCLSTLIVAKDAIGNCAVYTTTLAGCTIMSKNPMCWENVHGHSKLTLSWFPCNISGKTYSVGDVID